MTGLFSLLNAAEGALAPCGPEVAVASAEGCHVRRVACSEAVIALAGLSGVGKV